MLLTVTGLAGCTGADSAGDGAGDPDSAGPVFPTSREAWRWPFTAESPWNMPVGAGLATAGADDPCTAGVRDHGVDAWVNAEEWSHPVYRAADGDPLVPVTEDGERLGEVQSPAGATPADPQYPDGDAHLHLVNPAGDSVTEMWQARAQDGGWEVSSAAVVDLRGPGIGTDGVRIYGGSAIGGLVRTGEVGSGAWHALALSLPVAALEARAVWPATTLDTSREEDMVGNVPVGQLVVLPPDVPESIAHTPAGRALVRALRDYGAYVVDHASGFALYAEPAAEDEVSPARDDIDRIRALLACATNNSEDAPGGPGERAQPLAPPFE